MESFYEKLYKKRVLEVEINLKQSFGNYSESLR